MESSVRLLEDIKPSVNIDDALFEREDRALSNEHPLYSFAIKLPSPVSSRKVIFLGPNPRSSGGIETAHVAYQGSENYCVSKVVEKDNSCIARGNICIPNNPSLVRCKGVLAPLHFLVVIVPEKSSSDKDDKATESPDIQAYSIIPKILYESVREMMDKKYAILINALPKKYFEDNTIPNSISIPLEDHEKLSADQRKENFVKIIRKEQLKYPHMLDFDVEEVPLVVFCAHDKCDASDKMCELLFKAGFKKIFEYTGGQKDYDEKSGKTLDDSSSDEEEKEESDLESDAESDVESDAEEEAPEPEKKTKEEPESSESDFKPLTELGEAWASSASDDMKKREEKNNESIEKEESSDEEPQEPERNQSGGSKRLRRRKRRRRAKRVLRGGAWCFSFL